MIINKRHFTVVIKDKEIGRYSGASPRIAAMKIARILDGSENEPVEFVIRELGTQKYHTYSSYVDERDKTLTDPDWLGDVVKVCHVSKIGYERRD